VRRWGAVAAGVALAAAPAAARPPDAAEALTRAARALLAELAPETRAELHYDFDDEERLDLRLAPLFLDGVPLSDMREAERERVHALLAAGLSDEGLAKVDAIRGLEVDLRRVEADGGPLRWLMHFLRDPLRYFLTLYGEPGESPAWAFRFDGHHVSLNFTVVDGAVPSGAPLFLGANPRRVPDGEPRAGLRVLAAEEDAARALYTALPPALRERATLPFEGGRGLFEGDGVRVDPGAPRGVPRGDLAPEPQRLLDALVEVYVGNWAAAVAEATRREIEAAGRDAIHFAWAGSGEPGERMYYRVQGPTFLLEYDDTTDGGDHVHAIWRNRDGDFGRDLLAEHRARLHRGPGAAAHLAAAHPRRGRGARAGRSIRVQPSREMHAPIAEPPHPNRQNPPTAESRAGSIPRRRDP